ncbi:MAG: right-handed parallel beta-helix repeat-containing protein [Nitrososphaerales archaeon]
MSGNAGGGFSLFDSSDNNTLTKNTADGNAGGGFDFDHSSNNTLAGNTASYNVNGGFSLYYSSNNTLAGNTANDTQIASGFYLLASNDSTLSGNTANGNAKYGYYDTTAGLGTAGTANFYTNDISKGNGIRGSNPGGLGTPQP